MTLTAAEASALYLRSKYPAESAILKRDESKALEDRGWRDWHAAIFPDLFDCKFLPEHDQFWDWGWSFLIALRDKRPLPPNANAFLDLLSRNFGKSMHCEAFMVAAVCVVSHGIFLYVSGSQDLANEHLGTINNLLQSDGVTTWYPEHSRPKKDQITGANKAWTQKKLMTDGGATVWAIGLLVGVRGIRKDKDRVKVFVLDDVDDYDDSPAVALKKANTLGSSVLPTSDTDFCVIGAQNLITEHGVFYRIYTKQDMMLAHRVVCGPLKAFENLETEFRDGRDMIIAGESNWPERVTWDVGQRFIDTFGLIRFLAEFQHDFSSSKQGLCLENYDDQAHVITRTEFNSMFGVREVPTRWYKYQAHDHARTKTVFHANVMLTLAVSSMNERFPGFFFIDKPMSFEAQTEADEVALRFLKSVSPTVQINHQHRLWDDLVSSELKRTNIDSYAHDVTKMIRMRRATLAKIIQPAVGPMLSQKNYRMFRQSHEQNNAAGKVFRDVYGIPAQPCNPGSEGGLELFNHFLSVDYGAQHPCEEPCEERIALVMRKQECTYEEALGHIRNGVGPGGRGFTRTLIIVEDGELEYTAELSPERLHDSALLRYQWQHWRYTKPTLNDKGEKEWGPQKANDDFGNCLSAGTLIRTKRGDIPIEQVRAGDQALTRQGWRTVEIARPTRAMQTFSVALSNGQTLCGTADHRVWTDNNGWKPLCDLRQHDILTSCRTTHLSRALSAAISTASRFIDILKQSREHIASTSLRILPLARTDSRSTTSSSGKRLTDQCLRAMKSIIRMAIPSTTTSSIWSASQNPSTCERTRWSDTPLRRDWQNFERWSARLMRRSNVTATSAANHTPRTQSGAEHAHSPASKDCVKGERWLTSFARNAGSRWSAWVRSQSFVPASVVSEPTTGSLETVYNLRVAEVPEYFANGVLVHNCAMFLFHDQVPQAAPLNHGELVQEYMPKPLQSATIEQEQDPEKAVKLRMAAMMKQKGIEKQLQKRPSRNLIGNYRRFSKGR